MAECLERPCDTGTDLLGTSTAIRDDLRRLMAWLGDFRVLLLGLLVVLASVALIAALSGGAGEAASLRSTSDLGRTALSLSGDDGYDRAAGARPELFVRSGRGSLSGDAAYDPAAGARPERALWADSRSFSGDDAYDPAAGAVPK